MDFFTTNISEESIRLVTNVLRSTHISAGKMAEKLEEKLISDLGLVNPVTVNSGTSALHLGLAVAGVGQGDEVILPAQTFIATGLAILMQGAKPVFTDIQPDTGNIDPDSIRQKITEKTKAIIPVHWAGYPCDMDEINAIAKQFNLVVIEDAAHALGSVYKNRPIGYISHFTAFSFQAIKHLTSGDGGALCCLRDDDYYQAKRRRWFDIDRENSMADILGERVYDAVSIGFKYHMNDLAAALGLGSLEKFPSVLERHRFIGNFYRQELKKVTGLELLNYKDDRISSYWLFTVLVDRREDFIKALKSRGIPTSVVHLRIDKNSVFGGISEGLINQEIFNENQIAIPVHSGLSEDDINLVVNSIKMGW